MSVNSVIRAVRLTVVVLVLLQTETSLGFPNKVSSLAESQSSRLEELSRMSSRLEHKKLVRRKRLVSVDPEASRAVGGHLSLDLSQLELLDFQHALQRKRREQTDSAWADMEDKYGIFYDDMVIFISGLLSRLAPGTPAALQYMSEIPNIMPKDDPDFSSQKEDEVVERVYISLGFTARVIEGARQYVQSDSLNWFDSQAQLLQIWMSLVELTLASVRLSDEVQTIDYYKAGIGDINIGFNTYRPVNVDGLKELLLYI